MTTIYSISFLFLSSSFPYSLLFLIFPSFLSVEETGKGKRESQEKERRGRRKEKERKESLLLSSSLALLFLLFIFPSLLSFFPLFALFSLADATGMMSYVVFQTQRSRLSEMVVFSFCFSLRVLSGLFLLMYACLVHPFMQLKANSIGFLTRKRVQSRANHLLFFFAALSSFFFYKRHVKRPWI